MDALVLAGGRVAWADQEGVAVKALLRLRGETLLARALAALRGSAAVERLCVVGPRETEGEARARGADLFVPERESGIDNLMCGLDALDARGTVIVSASDLPWARPEDVDQLVRLTPGNAALSYPVVSREGWQAVFQQTPKRFIRLGDGEFAGGSMFVEQAPALRRIEPLLRRAFERRKSRLGMASLLGVDVAFRFALGRWVSPRLAPRVEDLRRRAEQVLRAPCVVVRDCPPRLAADVDHPQAWKQAQAIEAGPARARGQ